MSAGVQAWIAVRRLLQGPARTRHMSQGASSFALLKMKDTALNIKLVAATFSTQEVPAKLQTAYKFTEPE